MAQVAKIDSNSTGLAYAEEASLKTLSSPVWKGLEPNSYGDFGSDITTVAPAPITDTRSRKKGSVTDLDASGGFNQNLTLWNFEDIMQSLMFSNWERKGLEEVTAVTGTVYEMASTTGFLDGSLVKGFKFSNAANNGMGLVTAVTADTSIAVAGLTAEGSPPTGAYVQVVGFQADAGDIDVDISGDFPTLTSTTLDFTTLGLIPGQWIFLGGDTAITEFTNAVNNGFKRVRSISANALVLDKSAAAMVTEATTTETIQIFFGDVLRNRTGTDITRHTYHLERLLGVPDDAQPAQVQSQVLQGMVWNEGAFNIPTANLVNVDATFVGLDELLRTAAEGPLQTNVQAPMSADVYNTSSDFNRLKIAQVTSADEAPVPLATYVTEITVNVNNNVTANKAVAVLGGFDLTAGIFQVSGSVTAYFNNVSAIAAVRNNADITMDAIIVKNNGGIAIDIPLIALGDGRLNVEANEPVTIPLAMDAAEGLDAYSGFSHTLLWTWFAYLPDAAE
ncbi:MAG: hypothetical protein Tp138OMZ00d2C19078261_70 [Prokaryotic dsDNA virus sp.]|jgi:hypothetical protein|nr:MAG: hypothetical protein Tp138OMZ00d2C19078261_70 [Prokaryotic dsDNA virus sp.]|tara:strand:- start:18037 stop:19551 length:1515 start_codon:yes stop_codon:yes gene_type:complete